jgi:hypothetical protein
VLFNDLLSTRCCLNPIDIFCEFTASFSPARSFGARDGQAHLFLRLWTNGITRKARGAPEAGTASSSLPHVFPGPLGVLSFSLTLSSRTLPNLQPRSHSPPRLSIPSTGPPDSPSPTIASNRLASNMSSFISDATSKPKRRSVKKLERCQGFDISNGLSLIPRAIREREGPIGDLYESLKSLNEMRDISSQELRGEARQLFDMLGHRLWPRDTSRAWWLLKPPHSDYPRHLYYDDREDQEQYVVDGLHASPLLLTTTTDSGFTSRRWSRRSALTMKTT